MSETKKNEKMKPMIITDPDTGHEYTLEFNRKSVKKCEDAGLEINLVSAKSMTMIPLLFWGAFQMHHPYMKQEATDKILFEGLGGLSDDELAYLAELYMEPFKTLIVTEDEGIAENPRKMTVKF
jgi:hypothetical protein